MFKYSIQPRKSPSTDSLTLFWCRSSPIMIPNSLTQSSSPNHCVPLLKFVVDPGTSTSLWKKRKSNEPQKQLPDKKTKIAANFFKPFGSRGNQTTQPKPSQKFKQLQEVKQPSTAPPQSSDPFDVSCCGVLHKTLSFPKKTVL